jgi:hypothetical protein
MQFQDIFSQLDNPLFFEKKWNNGYKLFVIRSAVFGYYPFAEYEVHIIYNNTNINYDPNLKKKFNNLGLSTDIETYRGLITYYKVPESILIKLALDMENAFNILEKECRKCLRKNFLNVKKCWWCGIDNPV